MSKWNWKHIYAMLANDGKVKIGISKDVPKRIKEIENAKQVKIMDVFETDSCSNPHTVERMCHELFNNSRVFGEWFMVDFDVAANGIKEVFEKYARYEERKGHLNIEQIFGSSQESEKDEMMGAMCEVMLYQSEQITELSKSVESLAKATTNISEMFGELVLLLDAKLKSEKYEDG